MIARSSLSLLVLFILCGLYYQAPGSSSSPATTEEQDVVDKNSGSGGLPAHTAGHDKAGTKAGADGKGVTPARPASEFIEQRFAERVIGPLVMPIVGQILSDIRHVLEFEHALFAVAMADVCNCSFEKAWSKIATNEARDAWKDLRGPLNVISSSIQAEKRALEKHEGKARLRSVALAIVSPGKKAEDRANCIDSYYLICNENETVPAESVQGIGLTIMLDYPKDLKSTDALEATLWLQFLIGPRKPKGDDKNRGVWSVESRKVSFVLQEGNWVRETEGMKGLP